MEDVKKNKPKQASFLDCHNGSLVEIVGDKDNPGSTLFVIYKVLFDEIEVSDKVTVDGIDYCPPSDDLIKTGTILLPTYPEPYNTLKELVDVIDKFIYRYLDITDSYRKLATYYILLSWIYDCFETIPYLRAIGDYGTGKSRFQKVIGHLCYKPMFAGGATTPSPIFRIINLYRGTLIIDEADFRLSDAQSEIVKIFNCGYTTGVPVLRTEGDKERMPVAYDVFCPKIIATRERFTDKALESRCLTEVMQGNPRAGIPIHLPKSFYNEALQIRNMLLLFRLKHYGQVEIKPELAIEGVEARVNQILLPLLSIIEDQEVLEELKTFARQYGQQIKDSRGEEIQADVLKVLVDMVKEHEILANKSIAERVNKNRDIENGEYKISPAKIGRLNSTFYNFQTRKINGVTQIIWDSEKAQKLCQRYNIDYQLVDNVDIVDDSKEDINDFAEKLF